MDKKWKLKLFLGFILLICLGFSGCSHWNKKKTALATDSVAGAVIEKEEPESIKDEIESIPKKIKEEDSRFVDPNHILHINILNSQTISGAQKRLLTKLFPDANIEYIDSGEIFDAFNIEYEGQKYNAVFSFDQQDTIAYLDVIFITRGDFSLDNLESLFN